MPDDCSHEERGPQEVDVEMTEKINIDQSPVEISPGDCALIDEACVDESEIGVVTEHSPQEDDAVLKPSTEITKEKEAKPDIPNGVVARVCFCLGISLVVR